MTTFTRKRLRLAFPNVHHALLSQPVDDQQQGARPTTTPAANIDFPSPTFDPYVRFPVESVYSAPLPPSQPKALP